MGPKYLSCGKMEKNFNLDPGPTIPNIELVQVIFMYCTIIKFHVPRSISFCIHAKAHIHRNTHTHTHTDANIDSDEYSLVAFCKNTTITTIIAATMTY